MSNIRLFQTKPKKNITFVALSENNFV